jgi:glutathione synthase/RimK-type ligase-like ATP-grasp enzyme/gamma-glutamyl:cysteine ligase YbdK (ATP-grasp superfamily)
MDPEHQRACAAVYRLWPIPLLSVRFQKDEEGWKVVHVAPTPVNRLSPGERALLVAELEAGRAAGSLSRPKSPDKRAAIAVLYDEQDPFGPSTAETLEKLEKIASRRGVHVKRLSPAEISRLGDYDALFIRTLTGLNLPSFRFAARAEALGMPVIDDTPSIIRCSNKVFLHELLQRNGVPTPKTLVADARSKFEALGRALGVPFILKLPDGSFSTAVKKVSTKAEYRRVAGPMLERSPLLVAQAYTPTAFDWRVTTLGGKLLFVCKYHMASGHWQIRREGTRGPRYGKVEAVPRAYAPQDVVRVALKAARLVGSGLYGVDVKDTEHGPVVIEVNDNPNIDTGYDDAADGNAIYEEIVDHFADLVEGRRRPAPPRPHAREEKDPILAALRKPIGPPVREAQATMYRAFEVCGLELEYVVVDRDLNAVSGVAPALAALAGRPASDVVLGSVGFSNEIFDHVLELKIPTPVRSLVHAEEWLAEGVKRLSALLSDHFDTRLMPTGMHPWFDPRKAKRWTRSSSRIYETFERCFDVRTHGWANVQANHVNLPLGQDHEAVAMMNAAALLIPYLPALAASSPMHDGVVQPAVDNRLVHVALHQAKLPESCGDGVPEYVRSLAEYRRTVLAPMYAAVDRLPGAGPIRHEFLNARGAVFKFSRRSMEVRVIDMQECPKMDVALAVFVRSALKRLAERLLAGELALPDRALLVADYRAAVRAGTAARVHAPHAGPGLRRGEDGLVPMRAALARLLEVAGEGVRADERPYLRLVEGIARAGSLSERIAAALAPHAGDDDGFTDAARRIYVELTEALRENVPWPGREP